MADISGFASRLYRGEANLNIVGKRNKWFAVAGGLVLVAIIALFVFGFKGGIEFTGGNEFTIPASVSPSISEVQEAVAAEVHKFQPDARINPGQQIGDGAEAVYSIQTPALTADESNAVRQAIAAKYGIDAQGDISDSQISPRWGESVTQQALWALVIFLAAVTAYLSVRFEWRMAVAAVASLLINLVVTAGIYSVIGFEVTPNTVIGFLTILGFALYDVVVVFDKVQENTRGITGSSTQTYAEATNLALNQTFMRSINTSLVALLPVGGLLFIGAGLLGAGTLKDLGLVLFIGMGMAVFSSLFFASPILVWLKEMDPVIQNHTKRVLARRTQLAKAAAEGPVSEKVVAAAASPAAPVAPKAGAKPVRPARQGNTGRQGTGKRR